MPSILRMPGISADAEEAVLLEWLIAEGSEIHVGDELATVETEKANVEIEADENAILWRTLAEPGTSVTVGAPIAILTAVGEIVGDDASVFGGLGLTVPSSSSAEPASVTASVPVVSVAAPVPVVSVAAPVPVVSVAAPAATQAQVVSGPSSALHGRIFASPLARRIARENNIQIGDIEPQSAGARIVRADVERAIAVGADRVPVLPEASALKVPVPAALPQASTPGIVTSGEGYTDIPHTGMRRAVARFLTQSKREAPHFYLTATCAVDALLDLRQKLNEDATIRFSINDFVVKATAKALTDVPEMNVIWMDDAVRRFDSVDISVAIGSENGLVTPVIRSAEKLSLTEISRKVRDYAERAQDGKLKQSELEGGAFTVTNLGMFGVESFSAIINPPQAGILAVGAVVQKPVVVNGEVVVANTLTVTISVDHRPVDGVLAAKWLQRFTALIENPHLILA
jgi:pyruvate dehydrogenase E2 component (dihydrolipoamide acetyltransferase)